MSLDFQWQPDWLWLHLPGLEQQWHELHSLPGPGGHPQLQTGLEWRFEWLHWLAGCSLHGQLPTTANNCHSTEELVQFIHTHTHTAYAALAVDLKHNNSPLTPNNRITGSSRSSSTLLIRIRKGRKSTSLSVKRVIPNHGANGENNRKMCAVY